MLNKPPLKKMKDLIVKLLTDTISEAEKEELLNWLQSEENQSVLEHYIQNDYDLNKALVKPDTNSAYENVMKQIEQLEQDKVIIQKTKPVISIFSKPWFKYVAAASVVGILASGYFFRNTFEGETANNTPTIVNNEIKPGGNKAILTLDDGTQVVLEKGKTYQDKHVDSNGEELNYKDGKNNAAEVAFNYLTIPRGGQFFLKLSDGTQVWLNSESQLKYPVAFTEGHTRSVELIYGEAYFDVSPSTDHEGSDFKVFHKEHEVQVLGTEFNVKAYNDEINIYTTLVEGKVAINIENEKKILIPGEQSNYNTMTKTLNMSKVDVYDQISWKKGLFSFKRKPLKEIMNTLSRWYDMTVTFQNKEIETKGFNGVMGKDQGIQEILETLKSTGAIKNYEIYNKTILLK